MESEERTDKDETFFTVIIYVDAEDTLKDCLKRIVSVSSNIAGMTRIIVVDPICSEQTGVICNRWESECRAESFIYIKLPEASIGEAYNKAASQIRGRYVNFSLSSVLIPSGVLEIIYECAKELERPKLISLAPRTIDENGEDVPYMLSPTSKESSYEVINLEKKPARLQLFLPAFFIRCYIITNKNRRMSFKPELREDAPVELLLNILKEYQYYVFLPKERLYYTFQLEDNTSAFFGQHHLWWYIDSFKNWIIPFEQQSMKERWPMNRSVRIALLWLIASRFLCNYNDRNKGVLFGDSLEEFLELAGDALQYIDNELIYQKASGQTFSIPRTLRIYMLHLKASRANCRCEVVQYQEQIFLWTHPEQADRAYPLSALASEIFPDKEMLKEQNREVGVVDSLYTVQREEGQMPVLQDAYINLGFHRISSFGKEHILLKAVNYKDGMIELDGTFSMGDFMENDKICLELIKDGQEKIQVPFTEIYGLNKVFGMVYNHMYQFHVSVLARSLKGRTDIQFGVETNESTSIVEIRTPKGYDHVRVGISGQYWRFCSDWYLSMPNNKTLSIIRTDEDGMKNKEEAYQKTLSNLASKGNVAAQQALEIRQQYFREQEEHPNARIWVTFDKLYKAGDNGEYIYNYVSQQDDGIEIYYIMKEDSLDYERMRDAGANLLIYGEMETLVKALLAEAVLGTHSDTFSYFGFDDAVLPYICDLYNALNVCIQHGLTVQNIAQYQNRVFDNLHLYTLASPNEYENLCQPIYGFEDKSMLCITGLARFDGLKNNDKKQILITPSWRRNIVNAGIAHIKKEYNDYFRDSEYYRVYNSLINDEKLIKCARKNGYRIIFLLHPAISSQADDFEKNDNVEIVPATSDMNYEKILTESSLMVTDYSGIQFDFAYMKKPILYYHPESLPSHYDESKAFVYERDAFGPIIDNHAELVEEICNYMNNKCSIKQEYIDRVNKFFAYHDYDNCQRIYQEVLKALDKQKTYILN